MDKKQRDALEFVAPELPLPIPLLDSRPISTGHHHDGEFSKDCEVCKEEWVDLTADTYVHNGSAISHDQGRVMAEADWDDMFRDEA